MSETPVFIVGGTSFVGKYLLNYLGKKGGCNIRVMTRSLDNKIENLEAMSNAKVVEGDLLKLESLNGLIEPNSIVINLAYNRKENMDVNLTLINNLIKICKEAKINRLIHMSTADVVGRNNNDVITEDMPCQPITKYAITKQKIEKMVLTINSSEFDTVILRPTGIFGAEGANLIKLANDIVSGNRIKNYLKSCVFGNRRMNLVSIANVISSVTYLMDYSGNFNGQVFNISDDDSFTNNYIDIEEMLMHKFNVPKYFFPYITSPMLALSFFLKCLGRDNINPNRVYSTKKIIDLGFKKTMDFEAAVDEFAEWYRAAYIENNL